MEKGPNIWDHWFEQEPTRFFDGVGPNVTSQFYRKYKEDIRLMKEKYTIPIVHFMVTSLPEGTGAVNEEGIFYNDDQ
ncbi:family 1 glycosylhydrolase [Bacillus sp. SL00103]